MQRKKLRFLTGLFHFHFPGSLFFDQFQSLSLSLFDRVSLLLSQHFWTKLALCDKHLNKRLTWSHRKRYRYHMHNSHIIVSIICVNLYSAPTLQISRINNTPILIFFLAHAWRRFCEKKKCSISINLNHVYGDGWGGTHY